MTKIEIEIPAGKRAEWQEIDGKMTLVLVDDNVMERVKTFEDACRELGHDHPFVVEFYASNVVSKDVVAFLKLRIICAALNEGWEPEFERPEWHWRPWFKLYGKDTNQKNDSCLIPVGDYIKQCESLGFEISNYDSLYSIPIIDTRLYLKNSILADYCGIQFIHIWKDYLFG